MTTASLAGALLLCLSWADCDAETPTEHEINLCAFDADSSAPSLRTLVRLPALLAVAQHAMRKEFGRLFCLSPKSVDYGATP